MNNWIPPRHRDVFGILAGRNTAKKRISEAAVAGLIIYGWRQENYGRRMRRTIPELIDRMRVARNLEMSDDTYERILKVLRDGTHNSVDELRGWQSYISHQLDYSHLYRMNIKVVNDMDEGIDTLRSFRNHDQFNKKWAPLYVDTENSHHDLRNTRFLERLALITVFDTYSETVLLFRVQDLNDWQLEDVRDTLRDLNRGFNSFDDEKILSATSGGGSIPFKTLQRHKYVLDHNSGRNIKQQQSLKEAVAELPKGFDLEKLETVSDWTAPFLTHDQVFYAAMDAVVLHELWKRQYPKKWEELRKQEWIGKVWKITHPY